MKPQKNKNSLPKSNVSQKSFDLLSWTLPVPESWVLAGLFALAFAVKFICLFQYTASPDFSLPVGDSSIYTAQARHILAGGFFLGDVIPFQTPLYPAFMALWLGLFKQNFFLLRLVQIVIGSANVVVIYALTLRLARGFKPAALLAGLFAVGYGTLSWFDIDLLGIFFSVFCADLAVLLLFKAQETSRSRWAWLGGICFGLAVLERANLLLFVPVALWYLAGRFSTAFKNIRSWAWKPAVGFLAGTMLMILPVTINNLRVGHDFVLITYNAGVNLYFGNNVNASGTQDARGNPDLTTSEMEKDAKKIAEKATGHKMTPSQISRYWTRKALQFLVSDPAKVAWLYARKIRLLANPVEMPNHLSYDYIRHEMVPFLRLFFLHLGLMVPLAAVGLWAHFRHSPSLADKLFLAFLLTYALSLLPFFITDRYRLPLVPFLIAFAAVGCVEVLRLALARSWKELFWAGGILLAAAWAINQPFPFRLTFCHTRVTMADRYVDRSDVVVKPGNPDLSLAIVEYKQSIETQPSYSMAYQRLARVYEMVGYFTGNLKLLDTIEQLDSKEKPRWEAIRANIQEQLAKKGDLVAERKIPKTPYEKALADEDAGDIAHAMEKYEDIVHRDPFHFMAYSHWGNLEMKLGEKYKAISIFEEGLVENPESPDLLNGLAEAYYQTNNQAGYNRIRRILNGPRAGRE